MKAVAAPDIFLTPSIPKRVFHHHDKNVYGLFDNYCKQPSNDLSESKFKLERKWDENDVNKSSWSRPHIR